MKAMVKNIKNTLFWALFSNLDGFLQSIAHMNEVPFGRNYQFSDYITLQVTVSSVFNNTAKLHMSVQLLHKTPNNVRSMRSSTPVNIRSVNFLRCWGRGKEGEKEEEEVGSGPIVAQITKLAV